MQATDLELSKQQQEDLFTSGQQAAQEFLARWQENAEEYQLRCGTGLACAAKARAARGEVAPEQIQRETMGT